MSVFALQSPTFQPAMRVISAITNANPAQVTTSFNHNYGTGEIVKIFWQLGDDDFGMRQINGQLGTITVTGPTTFTINIDSTSYNAFSIPGSAKQNAMVLPVGEVNSTLQFATNNVL